MGAPSMEQCQDFDKAAFPLVPVQVGTWEGFVFVTLSEHAEPFEQSFAPLLGKFTRYQLPLLRREFRIDYEVRANWKLIIQNYSECYHCPTVHPALVARSPADSGQNDLREGPILGGFMRIADPDYSLTMSGKRCSLPVGELEAEDWHRVYYYAIFPNMLLSLHPDYVMVHTLWPHAPDRTRVECEWLFHADAAGRDDYHPRDAIQFWDNINRQDWQVCELSQLGIASRGYRRAPYGPRETLLAAFDRELLRALAISAPET